MEKKISLNGKKSEKKFYVLRKEKTQYLMPKNVLKLAKIEPIKHIENL
jgi:hypothetical protein